MGKPKQPDFYILGVHPAVFVFKVFYSKYWCLQCRCCWVFEEMFQMENNFLLLL